jgi:hypothetical protein
LLLSCRGFVEIVGFFLYFWGFIKIMVQVKKDMASTTRQSCSIFGHVGLGWA